MIPNFAFSLQMSITLDQRLFNERIKNITSQLNEGQSLVIVAGVQNEDLIYLKSVCAQNYLLGFEFPETLMAISNSKVSFVSSSKKLGILATLKGGIEIELIEKENLNFSFLNDNILILKKDLSQITGKLVTAFQHHIKDLEPTDATEMVGFAMAKKDEGEVETIKEAAELTSKIFSFYTNYVVGIIDSGKKVVHSKLSESLEQLLTDDRKRSRLRASENVSFIIQNL